MAGNPGNHNTNECMSAGHGLLLFLDVGGSMDPFIKLVEELFSAATAEFKNLEFFYFHNCLYERLWKDNRRRWSNVSPTFDVMNKFNYEYCRSFKHIIS